MHARACVRACMRACVRACVRACACVRVRVRACACVRAYTYMQGQIPDVFHDLKVLEFVWLNQNFLNGTIPPSLASSKRVSSLNPKLN